jgi:hypothetical protein
MSSPITDGKRVPHATFEDMLLNALVTDVPEEKQFDQLRLNAPVVIAAGRRRGLHAVSVRWLTGEFAIMFCEPGTDMPSPEKVVAAYIQCHRAKNSAMPGVLR